MQSVRIFKLTFLLLLVQTLHLSAQVQKMDFTSAPDNLTELFSFMKEHFGYRFFYNNDVVKPDLKVKLTEKEYAISDLLKELSLQTGLTFSIKENNLIVVEDNRKPADFSGVVTGIVRDSKTGETIPGVNVLVLSSRDGAATDQSGKFSVRTGIENDTLAFSCIGYLLQQVAVKKKSRLDVFLVEESKKLEEVVVTALNVNRTKNSLGYSVSTVKGDDINKARDNNVINSLAGRVAGLQITKSSTGVDGSTRVVLRGISSINGENRPLIVVDGIPVDAGHGGGGRWGGTDGGDALSDINPGDIESMSILKGAGAAAAYGSRGANGVVLITTRKGSLKKGLGVTFNMNYSSDNPLLYPELQNDYGHGAFGRYPSSQPDAGMPWAWSYGSRMNGESLPNFWGGTSTYTPRPNNYKDFFRPGSSFVNSIILESGNETSSVRASVTTQKSEGIVPLNGLNRQTINLRGFSKIKGILELDAKITYIHSRAENRPEVAEGANNPGYYLSIMPRNMLNSELNEHRAMANGQEWLWTTDGYTHNPYWQLYNKFNSNEKHRTQGVFSTKINFRPGFNLLLRSGMDFTSYGSLSHAAIGDQGGGTGGIGNSMGTDLEWNSDFLFTYVPAIQGDFSCSFNLGGNIRYNQGKGLDQWGSHLKVKDFYSISNAGTYGTSQWFSEKEVFSLYGLASIAYKNWLYFDLTLRNDWSSTLPIQNNSYMYHSENLSFLFTKAFNMKSSVLTTGKLRTSYSKVGNDTGPYQTSKYFTVNQTQLPYPLGGYSDVLASWDLQPEITASWEIGTNLEFFNRLFVLDVTYYRNHSENQIMKVPLPPSSGYSSKRMNAAKLNNTGIEVQLDLTPVNTGDFLWNIVATWAKNKSVVMELSGTLESIILDEAWHTTIQARPGEEYGAIYTTDFKRDAFGHKLVDDNGFALKGDYKNSGNINPDWLAGFSNSLTYKNLAVTFLIDMRMGGDIYSMGKAYRSLFGTSVESLEGRDEWYATHDPAFGYTTPLPGVEEKGYVENGININTGMQNTVPVDPLYRWYNLWAKEIGTENIVDATNVRMREISVAYSLPKKILVKLPVTDIQLSIYGRNLFFFYNAMNDIDPESGYSSGNTGGGFEFCSIPTTRNIGFNLRINF